MNYKVFKSDDGYKFVQSDSDDFVASYKDGEWSGEKRFDSTELNQLDQVEDPYEISVIVKEAKKALHRY